MTSKKADEATPADEAKVSLDEFCRGQSSVQPAVELLAAFFADERKAGTVKDTPSRLKARLEAFANRPVED